MAESVYGPWQCRPTRGEVGMPYLIERTLNVFTVLLCGNTLNNILSGVENLLFWVVQNHKSSTKFTKLF